MLRRRIEQHSERVFEQYSECVFSAGVVSLKICFESFSQNSNHFSYSMKGEGEGEKEREKETLDLLHHLPNDLKEACPFLPRFFAFSLPVPLHFAHSFGECVN